jgi:hypothetical protein
MRCGPRWFLRHASNSQRSAVPGFCFRTPGCARLPVFLLSPNGRGMERREAPRSLRGSVRPALRSASLRAKLPGPMALRANALRAVGSRGAGPCEEPDASWRSIRGPRCRRPHLAACSGVAIDGAFDEARWNDPYTRRKNKSRTISKDQ